MRSENLQHALYADDFPALCFYWLDGTAEQHYWPFIFVLMALPRASFLPHLLKTSPQEKITMVMFKTIQLELFFGFLLTLSGIAVAFLSWPSTQLAANLFVSPF